MTPEDWAVAYLRRQGSAVYDQVDGYWVQLEGGSQRNIPKHAIVEFANQHAESLVQRSASAHEYLEARSEQK